MRRVVAVFAVAAALAYTAQPSRGADLKDMLSGKTVPLTMQMKDLTGGWWRISVDQSGMGSLASFFVGLAGGGGTAAGAYYTQGQTMTLGEQPYLICYQVPPKPLNLARLMRSGPEPPKPEKLTPETKLSLSLVNLRTAVSLNDIRPFSLEEEIAASESEAGAVEEAAAVSVIAVSLSNLRQMALGVLMFASDHNEALPSLKDPAAIKRTLGRYIRNDKIFINPITNKPYMANAVLSGRKLSHIADPSSMVVFYEDSPAPDGTRGVSFLAGHTRRVRESEWVMLKKASKIP
jgi:hypothetical protein